MDPNAAAAYEPALLGGERPLRLLLLGFPGLRDRRLNVAVNVAAWGFAGIVSVTIPGLRGNTDHVFFCFLLLICGFVFLFLSVAAPDVRLAERAAARLEVWIGRAMP